MSGRLVNAKGSFRSKKAKSAKISPCQGTGPCFYSAALDGRAAPSSLATIYTQEA